MITDLCFDSSTGSPKSKVHAREGKEQFCKYSDLVKRLALQIQQTALGNRQRQEGAKYGSTWQICGSKMRARRAILIEGVSLPADNGEKRLNLESSKHLV